MGDEMPYNRFCRSGLPFLSGFSAIELMVVLAIAAILASLAAPSFRDLILNQRITATANDFFAAINLTRSESIKLGTRVDLVPADGTDWAKGWVVYVDENDNHTRDAGERVVFSQGPAPDGMVITSSLTDSRSNYLSYNGTGRTRTYADPNQPQFGHFLFTLDKKNRKIIVNLLGRPRVCNPEVDKTAC